MVAEAMPARAGEVPYASFRRLPVGVPMPGEATIAYTEAAVQFAAKQNTASKRAKFLDRDDLTTASILASKVRPVAEQ